jgi:hypothetical protein
VLILNVDGDDEYFVETSCVPRVGEEVTLYVSNESIECVVARVAHDYTDAGTGAWGTRLYLERIVGRVHTEDA